MSLQQRPPLRATKKKNKRVYRNWRNLSMVLRNPAATRAIGRLLLHDAPPHVWLLRGNLGAGKTTLIRSTLRELGVAGPITSPTFGLVRKYTLKNQPWDWAVHIDAYRIKGPGELAALEIDELIQRPEVLLFVEWPERLGRVQWGNHLNIKIAHSGQSRQVSVALRRR